MVRDITSATLALFTWPFVSGWKALRGYPDIMYDRSTILFLSAVALFLYVLMGGLWWEWHIGARGGMWPLVAAIVYAVITALRGALHIMGYEDEEEAY